MRRTQNKNGGAKRNKFYDLGLFIGFGFSYSSLDIRAGRFVRVFLYVPSCTSITAMLALGRL
ncbi:TPA: hypothetical protein DDZ86_00255 [Candidatus Dependentiae bacterium]|nr:hypothetical protein [Candidatus Dependentiae bacterium]